MITQGEKEFKHKNDDFELQCIYISIDKFYNIINELIRIQNGENL